MVNEFSTLDGYEGWFGSTIRKLPMWGDENQEISFEWPTEEAWSFMDPNTSITSIDFACSHRDLVRVGWVSINYSDGETKTFENLIPTTGVAYPNFHQETVNFDITASTPIRAVKAGSHNNGVGSL